MGRRVPVGGSAPLKFPYSPGLDGVVAGITRICRIDSEVSNVQYRGYDVCDLARDGCYEETAYLLIHGSLPTVSQLAAFRSRLDGLRRVPHEVYRVLGALPPHTDPMDVMRTAFSVLGSTDPDYRRPATDREANLRKAERILALAPTIAGNGFRIMQGLEPLDPLADRGSAANLLYLASESAPDPEVERFLDACMVLYAEHEFNASTFVGRIAASTLSDLYGSVTSAVCALKGPLHGGAIDGALAMILEIGSPELAEDWLLASLASGRRIMGFGHREHRHADPRASLLSSLAKSLGEERSQPQLFEIASTLERAMIQRRGLHANIDLAASFGFHLAGVPREMSLPVFASARMAGWLANAIEQLERNRIFTPTFLLTGDEWQAGRRQFHSVKPGSDCR
ncbi:MAG: citrate/2-methylcitrate synthase [Fimbriimonas sp.]|nr:citrate/2-methylcitrate synthase [Fimbriimonas sp.]